MGNNQWQIATPPLPAAQKEKGERRSLSPARSLAVRERQLADGCCAEMLADSAVSVSVLGKID